MHNNTCALRSPAKALREYNEFIDIAEVRCGRSGMEVKKESKGGGGWVKDVAVERPGGNESKRVFYIKKENTNI